MGTKVSDKVEHITEEMLCGIMPFCGPVKLTIEYSEKTSGLSMAFRQENTTENILDSTDEKSLSLMMVKGLSSSVNEPETGTVCVEI